MRRISVLAVTVLLLTGCKQLTQQNQQGIVAHGRNGGLLAGNAAPGGKAGAGAGGKAGGTASSGGAATAVHQLAPDARSQLRRTISDYLADRDGRAGLMVEDLKTGASFGYQERSTFITASVAKVNILSALLLQHQADHRSMSDDERDLASDMIRNSDNSAADALYSDIGQGDGMSQIDSHIGMTHTEPYPTVWGATQTCPYDQVRLLHLLTDANSTLTPAHRRYVLGLMQTVSSDQDWGISAAADDGETVALKNGWTPMHYQGSGWAVHSIGRITGPDHDFLVAVFSAEQPDMETGIRTIEHLASLTVSALRHPS